MDLFCAHGSFFSLNGSFFLHLFFYSNPRTFSPLFPCVPPCALTPLPSPGRNPSESLSTPVLPCPERDDSPLPPPPSTCGSILQASFFGKREASRPELQPLIFSRFCVRIFANPPLIPPLQISLLPSALTFLPFTNGLSMAFPLSVTREKKRGFPSLLAHFLEISVPPPPFRCNPRLSPPPFPSHLPVSPSLRPPFHASLALSRRSNGSSDSLSSRQKTPQDFAFFLIDFRVKNPGYPFPLFPCWYWRIIFSLFFSASPTTPAAVDYPSLTTNPFIPSKLSTTTFSEFLISSGCDFLQKSSLFSFERETDQFSPLSEIAEMDPSHFPSVPSTSSVPPHKPTASPF